MKTSGALKYVELEEGGYRVVEDWWCEDECLSGWSCRLNDDSAVLEAGRLTIKAGFRFDGGSFIARDTRNGIEGYTAHDALYRMGRQGKLPQSWRARADRAMYRLHRLCGMLWVRAQWLWAGVRVGAAGSFAVQPDKETIVKVA